MDGDRDYGITGLVFCGTEVRASSVVVPPDVTTDSDIERIIVQVRRLQILEGNALLIEPHFRLTVKTDEGKTRSNSWSEEEKYWLHGRLRRPWYTPSRPVRCRVGNLSKAFPDHAAVRLFRQR